MRDCIFFKAMTTASSVSGNKVVENSVNYLTVRSFKQFRAVLDNIQISAVSFVFLTS